WRRASTIRSGASTSVSFSAMRLEHGRLFPGRDPATVIDDATLDVAPSGVITYAGPAAGAPVPADGVVIDVGGRFVMPGLVDCHVHLCHDGVVDVVAEAADSPFLATVKAVANAQRALKRGVTTVR